MTDDEFARFAALYLRFEADPRDTSARVELMTNVARGGCWDKTGQAMHRTLLAYDVATLSASTLRERANKRGDSVTTAAVRMISVGTWPMSAAFIGATAWARVARGVGVAPETFAPMRPMFVDAYIDELVALVKAAHRSSADT
jgi:hypothetical protein